MNDTGPTCEACVRRWEMGDAQGTIDPHLAPWHDPHHALLAAKDAENARLRELLKRALPDVLWTDESLDYESDPGCLSNLIREALK